MGEIHFFWENIPQEPLPKDTTTTKAWIQEVIQAERCKLSLLNFIFCDDAYLLEINQAYLQHDTFTDIITFDNSEDGLELEGDIFVSVERVRENAQHLQEDYSTELYRVIIHGVLHLIGYADKTSTEQQEMRDKENIYLEMIFL